jgi:outer membrane murein-binding lipoprotein Lpp
MPETTPARWSDRLVSVPVWTLLLIGAATVGGTGIAGGYLSEAKAAPAIAAEDLSDMKSILARIDGRLEGMEREGAALRSELVSLRRDVNTLRADVDAIQRGR